MTYYDVFNGDADGLCALQQLRLAQPVDATLITGVKRDISLLTQVKARAGDEITVLDISLDKNREALSDNLSRGAKVRYFDHHFAGVIPEYENLSVSIDTSANTCTSLLVNQYLNGAYAAWAVVGAYGDNFDQSAAQAAETLNFSSDELSLLKQLGICLNYNGYGATIQDLHFPPAQLFQALHPYAEPLRFIKESDAFDKLSQGYQQDMANAAKLQPEFENSAQALYILPAEPWARRVGGVFANELAQEATDRAHTLLTRLPEGGYVVSVRAPFSNKTGADELCRQFATGGGRKAAAGINNLPENQVDLFIEKFKRAYPEA